MLTITRFSFALIVSLGIANNSLAGTTIIDSVFSNSAEIVTNLATDSNANYIQPEADASIANSTQLTINASTPKTTVSRIPEPSPLILLGMGMLGLGFLRHRKH